MRSYSEHKLFYHLYEKIISKEIKTFAELVTYSKKLKFSFNPKEILLKVFLLIKEINWGFFKDLNRSHYTKLWKELVLIHRDLKEAGDLKRNISISNIYVAMLDIHGYTRFCQESKGNLSRLHKLDEFLHEGIKKIASSNCALATRERGDEIVVVAATATDIIKTTLEILNSFSKRSVIKDMAVQRNRTDYSIILPDFKVTAGIAGGNLTTPLIITESGLLSGFLLNTAARLQTRANELSPHESKILVTQSVHVNFLKENKVVKSDLYAKKILYFLNNGPVAFKGMKLTAYEIIYKKGEKYRAEYASYLEELYDSLRQELWTQKIFADLIAVVREACRYTPHFSVDINVDGNPQNVSNTSLTKLCNKADQLYVIEEDYISAAIILRKIKQQLEHIPIFDRLVLDYVSEIYTKYNGLIMDFEKKLEREIEKKMDSIFNQQYKIAYCNSKKHAETYEKLKIYARQSKELTQKKSIWYALIEENREGLKLQMYSGKK